MSNPMQHLNSRTARDIVLLFLVIVPTCAVIGLAMKYAVLRRIERAHFARDLRRIERQQRVLDALDREGGR